MTRLAVRPRHRLLSHAAPLAAGAAAIALVTALYVGWLHVTNHTTVALSFLLVVLIVATVSSRRVAVATSLFAFLSFNYFFLPPVRTWTIADPENLVALFALLAVSLVASHLSTEVRRQAREATRLIEQRQEAEMARRSAELKSTLLASLGHDLKTPLTAVTVAVNNLDADWLSPQQRHEQADIARAELDRLTRLFQGLVDMARIETQAVTVEREWVQPTEIVEAAVQHAQRAIAGHALTLDPGGERALVRLDPRLTSAALAHVLENAGQYSPPGSTIAVAVSLTSDELVVAVRDEGPGIAAHERDAVFDRFYRGAEARQRRAGTGMGLAIARGLVAAQGGRVWADNRPEGGAVFSLAVPVETRTVALEEAV